MVKIKVGDKEIYYDGYLKDNYDKVKRLVKKDWDWVTIIDGPEGSGKSVLAQQIGAYVDPTLDISRVCFEPDEFKKAVVNAEQYQTVIFDEAFRGMSARRAMSEVNHVLNSMMLEIRQKNLFIFIVLPSFFHLDSIIALWRSRVLIHVYASKQKEWERGYFAFYNESKKKFLYMTGRKYFSYTKTPPNFRGRFTDGYYVDKEAYKKKKVEVLGRLAEDEDKGKGKLSFNQQRNMAMRSAMLKFMREELDYTYGDVAREINKYLPIELQTNGDKLNKMAAYGKIQGI
jgi:hypothetical protein|tara:strand:+ start:672 stop:1529 length:858 start_codon:yes stop_codon:yes gene_type:complete